jgi:hypothetical protein
VDENTSGGWLSAEWRFAPRHRIGFNYSRFTLHGERSIDRELHIGDQIYPVGADVSSQPACTGAVSPCERKVRCR